MFPLGPSQADENTATPCMRNTEHKESGDPCAHIYNMPRIEPRLALTCILQSDSIRCHRDKMQINITLVGTNEDRWIRCIAVYWCDQTEPKLQVCIMN